MATVFCPSCGRSNVAGARFCQGCGAALPVSPTAAAAPAAPPPPPPPGAPVWGAPQPGMPAGSGYIEPTPTPQSQAADLRALTDLRTGALYGIVGVLLSVIGVYLEFTNVGLFGGISCVGTTCTVPTAGVAYVGGVLALTIIGIVIGILAFLKYRAAFQALVPFDYRFKSPASLSILLIIGLVIVAIGFIVIVGVAASVIGTCSGGNSTACYNAASSAVGGLLGGAALLLIGGILAFIGLIMVLLGVWRMGTRYNEGLFKISAILMIIPFLDIAAPFLIYFSAGGVRDRVSTMAGGLPTGTASPFTPSPPPGAG